MPLISSDSMFYTSSSSLCHVPCMLHQAHWEKKHWLGPSLGFSFRFACGRVLCFLYLVASNYIRQVAHVEWIWRMFDTIGRAHLDLQPPWNSSKFLLFLSLKSYSCRDTAPSIWRPLGCCGFGSESLTAQNIYGWYFQNYIKWHKYT